MGAGEARHQTGALGLRGADEHASATYLASVSAAQIFCVAIVPRFDFADPGNQLGLTEARADLSFCINSDAAANLEEGTFRQKYLLAFVDAKRKEHFEEPTRADSFSQAHLSLQAMRTNDI